MKLYSSKLTKYSKLITKYLRKKNSKRRFKRVIKKFRTPLLKDIFTKIVTMYIEKRNNPLRVLGLIIINVIAVIIQSILLICIVVLPFFGWKRDRGRGTQGR